MEDWPHCCRNSRLGVMVTFTMTWVSYGTSQMKQKVQWKDLWREVRNNYNIYSHLKKACGYFVKSLVFALWVSFSFWGSLYLSLPRHTGQRDCDGTLCSILIDRSYVCHTLSLSPCLPEKGVHAKFMFLGKFWTEPTRISKAEESAAERRLVNYKAQH